MLKEREGEMLLFSRSIELYSGGGDWITRVDSCLCDCAHYLTNSHVVREHLAEIVYK